MTRVIAVTTRFWRPGHDYLNEIVGALRTRVLDGDFVIISEKAVSTASSNVVDESAITPHSSARFIARFWMRIVWGYCLCFLCHFKKKMTQTLQEYPVEMGSRHKQAVLENAGFLDALMFGSEGGIDGSNLAYSYVSLPLKNANEIADNIQEGIFSALGKKVSVTIVDTDKTYSFRNFHFTPRPSPIKGIYSGGGVLSYVVGRFFKLKRRATPLAVVGCKIAAEQTLSFAEIANRARGHGAGKTVWAMADKFGVGLDGVSWEMLDTVKHKPIVIIRLKR
jgi:F420-0:gamma-glutamyl ligase-like protein